MVITHDAPPQTILVNGEPMEWVRESEITSRIPFLQPNTTYEIEVQTQDSSLQATLDTRNSPWLSTLNSEIWIQPGYGLQGPREDGTTSSCTLGAILRDASFDSLFGLTAGHCDFSGTVSASKDPLMAQSFREVGEASYQVHSEEGDFMLIELSIVPRANISPELLHWTGPVGAGLGTELEPNADTVCIYGHVTVISEVPPARARCGAFGWEDGQQMDSHIRHGTPTWQGDSGSGIIHLESGKLVGIQTGSLPGLVSSGQSICSILANIDHHFQPLALLTADFQPPAISNPGPPPLMQAIAQPSGPGCTEIVHQVR